MTTVSLFQQEKHEINWENIFSFILPKEIDLHIIQTYTETHADTALFIAIAAQKEALEPIMSYCNENKVNSLFILEHDKSNQFSVSHTDYGGYVTSFTSLDELTRIIHWKLSSINL